MLALNLKDYYNFKIIYDTDNDFKNEDEYLNAYIYYEKKYFPYEMISVFDMTLLSSFCISCNKQEIKINKNNISKIAFAGACMMFHYVEKVKIVYDDDSYSYFKIHLDDMVNTSLNYKKTVFLKQKEEINDIKLLKTFKNLNNNINYYIYYDVIKTNKNKTIKSIILPDNELMYILAITLI
ncbi:MAG: hypothetical protein SOU19_09590 [Candidatus Caccosoma sp.]|nr:hypothetical protein [Candidatus Caccosoma sp.]